MGLEDEEVETIDITVDDVSSVKAINEKFESLSKNTNAVLLPRHSNSLLKLLR